MDQDKITPTLRISTDLDENSIPSDEINLSLSQKSLDKIDKYYIDLIEESKGDRVLSRYEEHIKFLYDSFYILLKNETDLFNKLSLLRRDFNDLNMKYNQALKLSSIDNKAKNDLVEELEKAWSQASIARSKEKRATETVNSLKLEIINLSKLVEQDVGLTMGQEYNLREIIKEKENILVENQKLTEEIESLKSEMEILMQKDSEFNRIIEEAKLQVSQSNQELLGCKLEIQKLSRKQEQLEDEISNQKRIIENKDVQITKLNQGVQVYKQDLAKQEQTIKELMSSLEKNKKEVELQYSRYQKLQNENDQLFIKNDSLMIENSQLGQQLKRKEEIIESQKFENIQTQKMRDAFERKIKIIEDQKRDIQNENQTLTTELEVVKKLNENLQKEKEANKKHMEVLIREKDQLYLDLKKSNSDLHSQLSQLKILKTEFKSLKEDNLEMKIQNEKLNKTILNFDKEKLKHFESLNELNLKISKLSEEIKLKELKLIDLRKKFQEIGLKLKHFKHLYESTRTDRNYFSKSLLKSKLEIKDIKIKYQNTEAVEMNLKKALEVKNSNLNKLQKDNKAIRTKTEKLESILDQCQNSMQNYKSKFDLYEFSQAKLLKIIYDYENKFETLRKDFNKQELEKSILGSQLVRRNDEISLLYEKIRLLEGILKRGEIWYQQVTKDLRLTQQELSSVKKQNHLLLNDKKLVKDLKKELISSERDLIIEKAKRSAVENMQKTMNIHRWRKLQACDPNTYELILKINFLQKQLIFKSEQLACLKLKFVEKDRLFLELKKYYSRRVISEEDSTLIFKYKKTLVSTTRQIKALIAENNMLQMSLV